MQLQHKAFAPGGAFLGFWMCIVLLAGILDLLDMSGCASSNPLGAAADTNQKAYALYGTFVVFEEQGARLIQDPNVSASIKGAIRAADERAKPSADALAAALQQYESAATALKRGTSTADKVSLATAQVQTWIRQAQGDIAALVSAVSSPEGPPPKTTWLPPPEAPVPFLIGHGPVQGGGTGGVVVLVREPYDESAHWPITGL